MICERCKKNEANFYYHENVNGNEKTYSLCSECAEKLKKSGELGDFTFGKTPFESLFSGDPFEDAFEHIDNLFGSLFAPSKSAQLDKGSGIKKCPLCGMTLPELAREGKVGCPTCYETFAAELEPTIGRIHGKTAHTGAAPSKFREKLDLKKQIKSLENEQKEAIKNECYERAAEIRDKLKELRGTDTAI